MKKLVVFSGTQPSGNLTIGNYIGALRQWIHLQDMHNCLYCIADLHAITSDNSVNILKSSLDTLTLYLSCGIDPRKSTIFIQSHVPEHTQLYWILNCYTKFGELNRMIQFKSKKLNNKSYSTNAGLFNYPVLMAADILLYQSNIVPVGKDQQQHMELICDIAKRFNKLNGNVFTIPKYFFSKYGKKIMSLLEPEKKMSKSDKNKNNIISLMDNPSFAIKKINRAVTDSDTACSIKYDPKEKPGISNLLNILSGITETKISDLEKLFTGKTYEQLKNFVAKEISNTLRSIQNRYYTLRNNERYLYEVLKSGAEKAKSIAKITLKNVYNSIGISIFK